MSFMLDSSSLNELIQPEQRLITLTGAGGKTSLSNWLASFFKAEGKRIITTTTTKIFPPHRSHTVLRKDGPDFIGRINNALNRYSSITVAHDYDPKSGKLLGLSRESISILHKSRVADVILVEGDGAACKPLKAPAAHEPVIPVETDLCIGVMGIDSVYRTMNEASVHRSEIFSTLTGAARGDVIRPRHLSILASSKAGIFKDIPAGCPKTVFLNKTDSPGGMELASKFMRLLSQTNSPEITWFAGSVKHRKIFAVSAYSPKPTFERETHLAFS